MGIVWYCMPNRTNASLLLYLHSSSLLQRNLIWFFVIPLHCLHRPMLCNSSSSSSSFILFPHLHLPLTPPPPPPLVPIKCPIQFIIPILHSYLRTPSCSPPPAAPITSQPILLLRSLTLLIRPLILLQWPQRE